MKDFLAGTVETFWSFGFSLVGLLQPKSPEPLDFQPKQRVLVIAPHPDDEVIGCGGTILRHVAQGDDVHVAYVTDGSASRAGNLSGEQMRVTRKQEAFAAASLLNVQPHWFGLSEESFAVNTAQEMLATLIADLQPTILYVPPRIDFHPIHIQTSQIMAAIIASNSHWDICIRMYQIQVPLTAVLVNRIVQVGDLEEQLRQAVAAHASQRLSLGSMWRQRKYAAARYRRQGLLELFWELDAGRYLQLHRQELAFNVRSLRFRPWFDPIAYLIGRNQRKRHANPTTH